MAGRKARPKKSNERWLGGYRHQRTPAGDIVTFTNVPLETLLHAMPGDIGATVWFMPGEAEGEPNTPIPMLCKTLAVNIEARSMEVQILWPTA